MELEEKVGDYRIRQGGMFLTQRVRGGYVH